MLIFLSRESRGTPLPPPRSPLWNDLVCVFFLFFLGPCVVWGFFFFFFVVFCFFFFFICVVSFLPDTMPSPCSTRLFSPVFRPPPVFAK